MVGGNPSVGGGGFAASPAGTAPLYYKSAEIASGSAKNLCKKSGDVGGVPCAAPARPAAVVSAGGEGGKAEPRRHLLSLPRGRGPSQTPKFLSPGPPSPWLPALLIEKRFLPVLRRVGNSEGTPPPGAGLAGRASAARVQPRGCKGRSPLHKKTLILPLPHRGRGLGG